MPITTTNKERFSDEESRDLAFLVYKRFGRDESAAADAWRRLLVNNCSTGQFMALVQASRLWTYAG
jgi:hypothetical protein